MVDAAVVRFTPTGVGNTACCRNCAPAPSVHPHGRGEYNGAGSRNDKVAGSLPRAWGILLACQFVGFGFRFTPTGVGNTEAANDLGGAATVHPHGRGEYPQAAAYRCGVFGSPPRAWGIRLLPIPGCRLGRFTPTGVGNTGHADKLSDCATVHPHGRGEYSANQRYSSSIRGSPPRAWGIPTV